MSDECVDSTKGCLEGREPVGRLLRDVQKYLNTVYRPLHVPCWLSGPFEIDCNRVCSPRPRSDPDEDPVLIRVPSVLRKLGFATFSRYIISSSRIGGARVPTTGCQGLSNEGVTGCANQTTTMIPSQEMRRERERGCIGEAPKPRGVCL